MYMDGGIHSLGCVAHVRLPWLHGLYLEGRNTAGHLYQLPIRALQSGYLRWRASSGEAAGEGEGEGIGRHW
jgi:hypothetical protein